VLGFENLRPARGSLLGERSLPPGCGQPCLRSACCGLWGHCGVTPCPHSAVLMESDPAASCQPLAGGGKAVCKSACWQL